MATNQIECAERIDPETLSALRDELLPLVEARRLREHIPTCAACQARVAAYDEVARTLMRQRELEPGDHILRGTRRRAEDERGLSYLTRRRVFSGLGALASVAAVLLLFVYVFGQYGGGGAGTHAGTPSATFSATPKATTPTTGNTFRVSDPQLASQLNLAYVQDNEVWIGMGGAQPRQVTHFGLSPALNLSWRLVWSDDSSKLLAVANENPQPQTPHPQAWVITTASGSVLDVPSLGAFDLSLGCAQTCSWLGDRYIVHVNPNRGAAHYQQYEVYDTQTQRDVSTALDTVEATELEVRGSEVYFSPYYVSPNQIPGAINRFDLATNTITANVFNAPGPLVTQGIDAGNWDVSADGTRIVYEMGFGLTTHCPTTTCYTYYQDATGTYALFPGYQSQAATGATMLSGLTISPDGRHAAVLLGSSNGTPAGAPPLTLLQEQTPSGAVSENTIAHPAGAECIIAGWTAWTPGIILDQPILDANGQQLSTNIYFAPLDGSGSARLVESLALPPNVFIAVSPS